MLDINTLPALVDELTAINTQLAVLQSRADEIKADLIKTGLKEVCGSATRAVISTVAAGTTTDYKAALAYYAPTADLSLFAKDRAGYSKVEVKGYSLRKAA